MNEPAIQITGEDSKVYGVRVIVWSQNHQLLRTRGNSSNVCSWWQATACDQWQYHQQYMEENPLAERHGY